MHADLPSLVLAELDARSAEGTQWMLGVVAPRFRGCRPLTGDPRRAALECYQQAQVVPLVGLVLVRSAIRVHALDIDDVDLARAAVDLVSLTLHGGDDAMGQIRRDRKRRRTGR